MTGEARQRDDVADRIHVEEDGVHMGDDEGPSDAACAPAVGLVFAVIGVAFLALLPVETRDPPMSRGWFTEPAFMPTVGLVVLTLAAAALAVRVFRDPDGRGPLACVRDAFGGLETPLEFGLYFGLYVWLLGWLGYAVASLVFAGFMVWRVGLRARRWALGAVLLVVVLTGLLRGLLGVWFPSGELFVLLPDAVRSFAISYL